MDKERDAAWAPGPARWYAAESPDEEQWVLGPYEDAQTALHEGADYFDDGGDEYWFAVGHFRQAKVRLSSTLTTNLCRDLAERLQEDNELAFTHDGEPHPDFVDDDYEDLRNRIERAFDEWQTANATPPESYWFDETRANRWAVQVRVHESEREGRVTPDEPESEKVCGKPWQPWERIGPELEEIASKTGR